MNKQRRKEIARALSLIQEASAILETCRDEEQEYYDNMPESIQSGDRGDASTEAISALEDALANLEEADGLLSEHAS